MDNTESQSQTIAKAELPRCFGYGPGKEFYADYHDNEWGIPVHDDRQLFEMLILEGALAGLSWETILKRREGYREVFFQFDIERVANLSDNYLEGLRSDTRIIRNRLKIYSTRTNAQIALEVINEFGSFDNYLWKYVDGKPIKNHWNTFEELPATSPISDRLSKDLKKRGMSFVGSTIIYAFMQATGMVNDHLTTCWKYQP